MVANGDGGWNYEEPVLNGKVPATTLVFFFDEYLEFFSVLP